MKLPIFRAIAHTFKLVFSNIYAFMLVPALGVFTVVELLDRLLRAKGINLSEYEARFAKALAATASDTEGLSSDQALGILGNLFSWLGVMWIVTLVGAAIIAAAGMRYVIGRDSGQKLHFRLGIDEIRILFAWVLAALGAVIILVLGVLVILVVANYQALLPSWLRSWIGWPLLGSFCLMMLWYALRTSLIAPAAVAERKLGLAGSFRATRNNVLRLTMFWFLVMIPMLSFYVVVHYATFGVWPGEANANRLYADHMDLYLLFEFLWFFVNTTVMVAGAGTVYLLLKEPGEKAPANPQ